MSEKKYLAGIFTGTLIGMLILTAIMWKIPCEMYFDKEYPAWKQQRDYIYEEGTREQILFLGDSAFKAAVVPEIIGENAYNLSLGGAGAIEMYYSLKNYLKRHPKPEKVFISISPIHFIYLERYRDRALYFHFLTPEEMIESQRKIFELDAPPLPDKILMSLEDAQFAARFPTKYFQTIKTSELLRKPLNDEIYEKTRLERGHMLFGNDPNWYKHYVPHEQLQVDFKLLRSLDYYMRRLLNLCVENEIPFQVVQTPINKLSYGTASKYDYFAPYQDYLRELARDFGGKVETELVFYDVTLFGDHLHLNEKGAALYSENLKRKYIIDFTCQVNTFEK